MNGSRLFTLALGLSVSILCGVARAAVPGSPPAPAASTDAVLDEAFAAAAAAEERLDYEEAAILWMELISRTDLTPAQRISANFNAGRIARIRGQDLEARMHFSYVLQHAPDYQVPPNAPPKVRHFFELVRQEHQEQPPRAAAETTAPEQDRASADSGLSPLWITSGAIGAIGAALVAAGGVAGWLSLSAEQSALETSVQTERVARYDERDLSALLANVGYVAGGVGLMVGVAFAAAALLVEGE